MAMTQVADVMTRGVRTLSPEDSMLLAAKAMEELNVGSVPVCDGEQLLGMVTDRDIAVRGVAHGKAAESTPLSEVMTQGVRWCFEDDSIDKVLDEMRDAKIRRVPVVDRDKHLVGILSLGDVAAKADTVEAGEALADISEPAQPQR
jgi:CBS domain-containing protein